MTFVVLLNDPTPVTYPEWQIDVTNRDGSTTYGSWTADDLAADAPILAFTGQDPMSDIGAGAITFQLTDSANALLAENRLLHLNVRGTRVVSMLVKNPNLIVVSSQEEAGEVRNWQLETLFGVLGEGDVDPPGGVDSRPAGADRIFDSSDPARDNSDFTAAYEGGSLNDATAGYPITPYGFGITHRDDVKVIGANTSWTSYAPEGRGFGYIDWNFSTSGYYKCLGTFDNAGEVRVDGVTIQPYTVGFGEAFETQKFWIDAGVHRVWFSVDNYYTTVSFNPHTAALSFIRLDGADNDAGLELATNNQWFWYFAPASAASFTAIEITNQPGFTIGQIVRVVLEENQAHSCLLDVTLSCTDTHDSAGVPWANTWNVSTKAGTTTVASFLLKELSETYADFKMRFEDGVGMVLDVFAKDGRGQDTSVQLLRGVNIGSLSIDTAPRQANDALVEWNNGGDLFFTRVTSDPDAGQPRKEQPLVLGAQRSFEEMIGVAHGQLRNFRRQRFKIQVTHLTTPDTPDGEMPGLGYWVGDTITVPTDADLTPGVVRVIAMTWELDRTTGLLRFTPELGDDIIQLGVRPSIALRKLAPGTLGGQARVASPRG